MRRLIGWLALVHMVAGGCASGPTYDQVQHRLPALEAGMGRLMFYRDGAYKGAAIQPTILVDGAAVGSAQPGGFFFVDRPAGRHRIACEKSYIDCSVQAGQTHYFEGIITSGEIFYTMHLSLVEPEQGARKIGKLSYVGPVLATTAPAR